MRVLYIKNAYDYNDKNFEACRINEIPKKPRVCSNSGGNNEETKVKYT